MFVTVKVRVYTDATGVYTQLPALLTSTGVLETLLDYCLYRSHVRSLTWMRKVTRSVRMFLEYLQTNPEERDTYRLFQNFAQRLYTGTFDRETGLDPSGLCWAPRSPQDASHIITHLTDFFGWLGEMRSETPRVNPRYAGGAFDRQTEEAAYQYRRSKAFLGHTWAANVSSAETGSRVRGRRLPKVETSAPPAFPEERIEELLVRDSARPGATTIAACSSHCCCTAEASVNLSLSTFISPTCSRTPRTRVKPRSSSTTLATVQRQLIGTTSEENPVKAIERNTSPTILASYLALR